MKKLYAILMLVGLGLIGCSTASVTILPQGNNKFTAMATSSSQSDAMEEGMKKAHATCQATGSTLEVLDTQSKYSGADQNLKQTISAVSLVATGNRINSNDHDDYTVTIKFKCIN